MIIKDIETVAPVLMTTIVDRGEGDSVSGIFSSRNVYYNLLTLGFGTASKKILSFFGFGETEKDVIFSYMSYDRSQTLLKELEGFFGAKRTGYGVAFTVPMDAAADTACQMGLDGTDEYKRGGASMENYQHDLIVVITTQGYVDDVMEIAKDCGATGGTVLRARGVGAKEAEKFFGITVQPEKDMIFIVIKKELRSEMMRSIIESKGPHTDARGVVFSLPVNGVAGMNFEPWESRKK